MRQLRLVIFQVGYEQRSFWRNPAAAFFTFAFPVVLLIIFATMNRTSHIKTLNVAFAKYYVPSMVAFGVMGACFTNLGALICLRRQSGYLKRLRATPLRPATFFAGVIGHTIALAIALTAVITIVGALAYDVPVPENWPVLLVNLAVGGCAFCLLGIAAATIAPDVESAPIILSGLFYPLLFISGAFYPAPTHSILARIASLFPVVHFINGTFDAFAPNAHLSAHDLLVVTGWGVAAVPIAVTRFRWSPVSR